MMAVAALALTNAFDAPTATARQAPAPRVVAIGDVHGSFDSFVEILQTAGLVDAKLRWAGGTTIFVQTGDLFDRGPKVRETLDLLIRLEDEARRAGGRVEFLLGNHEMMNLLHEFRDASPTAYVGFADARSEARRQRAFDDYARLVKRRATPGEAAPVRDAWMATHPPGFLEYVDAIGPRGKYGRWLRAHKVVTTVGRTAFMHAGIPPGLTGTFEDINNTAAREIAAWDATLPAMVKAQIVPAFCTLPEAVEAAVAELQRIAAALQASAPPGDHVTREFVEQLQALLAVGKSSLFEPEGPLWFRGFAQWPDTPETATAQVTPLLTRFGVDRFVTGHTPSQTGRVVSRFDNRFILIDTGMVFKGGRPSAVELLGGTITAIYTDSRVPIVSTGAASFPREALPAAVPRATEQTGSPRRHGVKR
jgi:Calcineurin-like phosphoesterase